MATRDAARGNTRMRFEQWAQNPGCEANAISAVHNVKMAHVARAVGIEPTFGQSPFAMTRGKDFESSLFRNQGARLLEELVKAGVLPPEADGFLDLRLRMNGGPRIRDLDGAIGETRELIGAAGKRDAPPLVAGATVRIPRGIMLPEAILIIDALAIRTDLQRPTLVVGEIKAYPDRGGYTDRQALASARAQAGLYVHALELVVEQLTLRDAVDVSARGFLVLTRPGSYWPSIRANEDLRYQAQRAARGFDSLERAASRLPDVVADEAGELDVQLREAILHAEHKYSEACLSFCDLAPRCHADAAERGDAIVLGDDVRRFVGGIKLPRLLELLDGAESADETELDFMRRIAAADPVEAK